MPNPIKWTSIFQLAVCIQHNYLHQNSHSTYTPPGALDTDNVDYATVTPGDWCSLDPQYFYDIQANRHKNVTLQAKRNRALYVEYFNNAGKVAWQDKICVKYVRCN